MIEPTTDLPIAPELVNCRKTFQVSPGTHVKLKDYETSSRGKHDSKAAALLKSRALHTRWTSCSFVCMYLRRCGPPVTGRSTSGRSASSTT